MKLYKLNLKTKEKYKSSKNIVARNESLEKQARSAQTNGAATSYINTGETKINYGSYFVLQP